MLVIVAHSISVVRLMWVVHMMSIKFPRRVAMMRHWMYRLTVGLIIKGVRKVRSIAQISR